MKAGSAFEACFASQAGHCPGMISRRGVRVHQPACGSRAAAALG